MTLSHEELVAEKQLIYKLYFVSDKTDGTSYKWKIFRSYEELRTLATQIERAFRNGPEAELPTFPPSRVFRTLTNDVKLDELNTYMTALGERLNITLVSEFLAFL